MEQKQSDLLKQRIKEIEETADTLVRECEIMFVSLVTENGYSTTSCVSKLIDEGFRTSCL